MLFIATAMLVAIMTLGACDSQQASTPSPTTAPTQTVVATASPTSGQATATPAPTTMPTTPAGGSTTISFETTGTIAGIRELLSIDENGNTQYEDRNTTTKQGTITAQQYAALIAQISKADFFNLEDRYDAGTVSDDTYYKITVQQDGKTKSVTVAGVGGENLTPQPLQDLITMLKAIQDASE
jgi:glucose/arabinose dehydrogenase